MQEEKEDLQQFFRDWSATAEQTLRELRSFTVNYYNAVGEMLNPIPWLANFNKKLHGYVEQDFDAAVRFVKDVGQASDVTEFNRIYVAYIQQCVELFAAQARDFAEAYLEVSGDTKARSV
jgi:Phasin protein